MALQPKCHRSTSNVTDIHRRRFKTGPGPVDRGAGPYKNPEILIAVGRSSKTNHPESPRDAESGP